MPHLSKAKYTYIGDVDILIFENILSDVNRMRQMEEFQLPYSDVIRPGSKRLTGLLLVKTSQFFSPIFKHQQTLFLQDKTKWKTGGKFDEKLLYRMCKKVHGLPPPPLYSSSVGDGKNEKKGLKVVESTLSSYRPVHGLHLSPNRGPSQKMKISYQWCSVENTGQLQTFLKRSWISTHLLHHFVKISIEQLIGVS